MSEELQAPSAGALLEDLVRLKALKDVVEAREKEVRADLEAALYRLEETSETDASEKKKGVGACYITVPNVAAGIEDPVRFEAWARSAHPDRVQERTRLDAALVLKMAEADPDLEQRLVDAGAIGVDVIFSEDLLADVVLDMPRNELGSVIDGNTGEFIGASVKPRSKRTLNVRLEPKAIERYVAELSGRLQATLTTEGDSR